MNTAPDRTEAAEYYFTYIDKVGAGDINAILEDQGRDVPRLLRDIPDDRSLHRYAADKWSVRQVLSHINDTERVFAFRAFWFARGYDIPLPSFDQEIAARSAGAESRSWSSHIDEFGAVRAATLAFFRSVPPEAWGSRGIASGYPFTVRALAYIMAGHVEHHSRILKDSYL